VISRLGGPAIFLLGELAQIAGRARAAARRPADQIGDLGSLVTVAPASCPTASPAPRSSSLPDCSDVASISACGLQWLNTFSGACETF
jgi:hypothetical protein